MKYPLTYAVILCVALAVGILGNAEARDHGDRHGGHSYHSRDWHGYRDYGWYDRHHYRRHGAVIWFGAPLTYYSTPSYYLPPEPVPQQVYNNEPGQNIEDRYCREYQSNVRVGGAPEETYGNACLQPDGSWEIIN